MSSFSSYLLQTLVSLGAVCALAFVVLYAVRRLGGPRTQGPLALVGQLPLGGNRAVYVVRVGKQVLVLGSGENGLSRVGELSAEEASAFEAEQAARPTSFAQVLARLNAAGRMPNKVHAAAEIARTDETADHDPDSRSS